MKEKVKKVFSKFLFMIALVITSIGVVNAEENVYYVNNNGVEMTEEQYNNLLNFWDEDQISSLTQKGFEWRLNAIEKTVSTTYVVERTAYDKFGRVLNTDSVEVENEQEAIELEESLNSFVPYADASTSYETASKRITLELTKTRYNGQPHVIVSMNTTWLNNKVPKIKSYDVSAHRYTTGGGLYVTPVDGFGIQSYNRNGRVDYSYNGDNTVSAHNGYGTSMNIVDDATKNLDLTLEVLYYYHGSGYLNVYATYQHCTEYITLAQSQDYYFAEGGLGNVLKYTNATIRGYYDGMLGVMTSLTI